MTRKKKLSNRNYFGDMNDYFEESFSDVVKLEDPIEIEKPEDPTLKEKPEVPTQIETAPEGIKPVANPSISEQKTKLPPEPKPIKWNQNPASLRKPNKAINKAGKQQNTRHSAMNQVRSWSPLLKMIAVGVGLAAVIVLWLVLAAELQHDSLGSPTIDELQREVKNYPKNAETRLLLGHALFSDKRREMALQSYNKALELKAGITDTELANNLIACFGTRVQSKAANLIIKYKLTDAEEGLRNSLNDKRRSVRFLAMQTLGKLGKAKRADRLDFYILDLQASDCEIRLRAVKNLGNLGSRRAISFLQVADRQDKRAKPKNRKSCLGNAATNAVKKIRRLHDSRWSDSE